MKKTLFMLAAATLMLVVPSCKKGENDPAMSLASRKSRVANDWTMTDYDWYSKTVQTNGDWNSTSQTFDAGVITVTDSSSTGGTLVITTSTIQVDKADMTFDKKGGYTRDYNTTTITVSTFMIGPTTYTSTTTAISTTVETGNWSFIGKSKEPNSEFKNKERMVLNALTADISYMWTTVTTDDAGGSPSTTGGDLDEWYNTYHSGEVQRSYEIDRLKGKEMVLKMYQANSGTYSSTPSGGSTTVWPNSDYNSSETLTLGPQGG
jgi:hypothetical protein